eukprot:311441_1
MGLSFFVALCSILILCKSLITPTIINITGEYYINSQSTSFIRNTITCTTSTCIILCDIIDGCFETIIDASASTTLILRCLEYQSCKQANLINGPSNLAELHCLKYSACKNANFSTQNTSNVNIECNHVDCVSGCVSSTVPGVCRGATFNAEFANIVDVQCIGESGDCFEAIFNVNNADTVKFKAMKSYALNEAQIIGGGITNALIIDCSDTYTCFRVNIYCPQNAACNINCTDSRNECYFGIIYIPTQNYSTLNLLCDSGACDSMQFTCQDTEDVSDLIWAAGYVCLTNDCCPTELQRPISILDCDVLFANGTECVIDCSDYGGCPFKTYINGSRSNSLTLNCDGNYECKYIDVYCPYNGECNINCLGSFSCEYMNIKKETIASLSLNCLGTPSHSCKGINVDVMVSNTVLISCTGGSYSCLHGVFDIDGIAGVTNMNIEIEGHSAFNGDAYFSNINEINISCNGVKACGPDIFASNIGSLDVYCIGYRSCPSFDWNVETEDFMVHCLGDSSCIYMNLMANITNSLSITTTNNTAFANSVITVDCMDCLNTYNCMENITLYCGANETQYIIEEADNCRNCECDTMLTTNTFIPYENNIWQQCTPTPQPTTDPTMEPTVEPTTNPTFNPTINPTINSTINPTVTNVKSNALSTDIKNILIGVGGCILLIIILIIALKARKLQIMKKQIVVRNGDAGYNNDEWDIETCNFGLDIGDKNDEWEIETRNVNANDIDVNTECNGEMDKFHIGDRLLVEVEKILKVEASIIDIPADEWIVVQYDSYNNNKERIESLHVQNDRHRFTKIKQENNKERNISDGCDNDKHEDEDVSVTADEENECIICLSSRREYLCVPCGHLCLCKNCKDLMEKCPVCRTQ